jgi:hypothetical protein
MSDITIICKDCKTEFIWTEAEQQYYAEHKFVSPKRCKACRSKRKAEKVNQ